MTSGSRRVASNVRVSSNRNRRVRCGSSKAVKVTSSSSEHAVRPRSPQKRSSFPERTDWALGSESVLPPTQNSQCPPFDAALLRSRVCPRMSCHQSHAGFLGLDGTTRQVVSYSKAAERYVSHIEHPGRPSCRYLGRKCQGHSLMEPRRGTKRPLPISYWLASAHCCARCGSESGRTALPRSRCPKQHPKMPPRFASHRICMPCLAPMSIVNTRDTRDERVPSFLKISCVRRGVTRTCSTSNGHAVANWAPTRPRKETGQRTAPQLTAAIWDPRGGRTGPCRMATAGRWFGWVSRARDGIEHVDKNSTGLKGLSGNIP